MKKIIASPHAPSAIGPYSQAQLVNNILYTSGQIGLDPQTGMLREGLDAQTIQALENLKSILNEAGMDMENVIKTTVFLHDMNDFTAINKLYQSYFPHDPPARSCVAVACLPKNALIEIECIAVKE